MKIKNMSVAQPTLVKKQIVKRSSYWFALFDFTIAHKIARTADTAPTDNNLIDHEWSSINQPTPTVIKEAQMAVNPMTNQDTVNARRT